MFFHVTPIAEEKHVIHLLLVLTRQLLLLSSEPHLEFFHLLPQSLSLLLGHLTLGIHYLFFLFQSTGLCFNCLSHLF